MDSHNKPDDALSQFESIINAKFTDLSTTMPPISVGKLTQALNEHITANKDTDTFITIHITEDNLSDFVETPLGQLWAIMAIQINPKTTPFILQSIRNLRRILSNIKTVTDAKMIQGDTDIPRGDY